MSRSRSYRPLLVGEFERNTPVTERPRNVDFAQSTRRPRCGEVFVQCDWTPVAARASLHGRVATRGFCLRRSSFGDLPDGGRFPRMSWTSSYHLNSSVCLFAKRRRRLRGVCRLGRPFVGDSLRPSSMAFSSAAAIAGRIRRSARRALVGERLVAGSRSLSLPDERLKALYTARS